MFQYCRFPEDHARTLPVRTIHDQVPVVRRTFLDAAQGVVGSQRLAADLAREAERQGEEQAAALMEAATLYQRAWTEEESTRALLRMTGPAPLPHPDDLVIDFAAGRVLAIGPMTHQQKALNAAGGPGSESVPSRKQPYEFTGTRAELCLLRALPDERRRAPIVDNNGPGASAFERLADALDAMASLKSMLADRNLPEEVRNRIESVLKKAGHIRDD